MTTFLQPGDKIVLCAPGSLEGSPTDQEIVDMLTQVYKELGVTVVFVALGSPQIPLTVVSVTRESILNRPMRSAGKLKLVDRDPPWYDPQFPSEPEATEPLRAHLDPPALSH